MKAGRCIARPNALANSALVTGVWCCRVESAFNLGGVDRPTDHGDPIIAMDPWPVLAPRSKRAACAKFERQEHLRQSAATTVEHEARPDADDARGIADAGGFRFPCLADLGQKVRARRLFLGDGFVAMRPVVADRRTADESPGPPCRGKNGRDEGLVSLAPGFRGSGACARPTSGGRRWIRQPG